MGVHEACRNTADAFVANFEPDVCYTPYPGLPDTPVPYNIIGFFNNDINPSEDVYFTGDLAANNGCVIEHVQGNEAGTHGGIHSGVNLGACRPKLGNTGTIYVNGMPVVPDSAEMDMNFEQPLGVRNCLGMICYAFRDDAGIIIAPAGSFIGPGRIIDLNPLVEDFTEEELSWAEMTTGQRVRDVVNRGVGLIQMGGGGLEIAGGSTLFSAGAAATGTGAGAFAGVPSMVLGGAAVLHGFDNIQAGFRMFISGDQVNTLTQDAIDNLVYNGDPPDGITVGTILDGTISLGTSFSLNLIEEGATTTMTFLLRNQEDIYGYVIDIGVKVQINSNLTLLEDITAPDDGFIGPLPEDGVVITSDVAATPVPTGPPRAVLDQVPVDEIEALAAQGYIVSIEHDRVLQIIVDPTTLEPQSESIP